MDVNKYKIGLTDVINSGITLTIPLFSSYDENLGQEEVLNNQFVNEETEKAINAIIDYEKVRFSPFILSGTPVYHSGTTILSTTNKLLDKVEYRLNFLNSEGEYYSNLFPDEYSDLYNDSFTGTSYSDIGYIQSDLKFQRNNLMKSFATLMFYDSDDIFNQNLLFYISLETSIKTIDSDISTIPVRFVGTDPIKIANFTNYNTDTYSTANGFFLYDYKIDYIDENNINIPKEVYLKVLYNNAKTGKSILFMNNSIKQSIKSLNNGKIFTKFILEKQIIDNAYEYIYTIDTTYSNNGKYVSHIGDNDLNEDVLVIDLYQINVN